MPRLYQGSFSAGEISPSMWGRIDAERFQSGVRVGRNVFFRPEGGVDKRPGLQFCSFAISSNTADQRLIPFKFNNEQTYIIVAEASTIWFIKDGAPILDDQPAGTPSFGSDGTGVYIDHTGHGFVGNERLYVRAGGYNEVEGRFFKVDGVNSTANRIYLLDFVTNNNVLNVSFSTNARTIDYGEVFSLGTSDGWFSSVEVSELDFTQANDTLYVSHPQDETKVIVRGASDILWTITDFSPNPGPSAPTAAEDTLTGANYDNLSPWTKPAGTDTVEYVVTAIENDTFEESLASSVISVTLIDIATMASATTGAVLAITHQSGSDKYRIYKSFGGLYGLVGTVEGTSGTIYFGDPGYTPNLSIAPPLEVNPTFNATDEYPGAVELFQQRIWFGRTNAKLRDIYASRSGSFSSFASTTIAVDDDPVVQQIAARSVHEVRYFVPLRDLVVLTSDGVWGFDTGDVGALTPSAGLVSQSFWGSARVKPALVGESALYVGESGRTVRDLAFSLQEDGFASGDLTLLARHLFAGRQVVSMCFAEVPYNVLFCVMSDGRAISCTYVRDQQIFAWARHDTGGRMLDCASVRENGVDNIYVSVERTADESISTDNRWRQIERMVMDDPQFADQGFYLDNGIDLRQGRSYDPAGEVRKPRIVSGELEIALPDDVGNDTIIQLRDLENTPLAALNNLSIMVDATDADQTNAPANYDFFRVYRHEGADKVLFEWEDYLPPDFITIASSGEYHAGSTNIGFFDESTVVCYGVHHLYYRGSVVEERTDHASSQGNTVNVNGVINVVRSGLVHLGEPYVAEIETLDIDDPQDPVTGLPIQIGGVLLRFELCRAFTAGRSRKANDLYVRSDVTQEEGYSINLGGFQGVIDQTTKPTWNRSGRMIVRSYDGFPWKLSAIIPLVDAGDIDA